MHVRACVRAYMCMYAGMNCLYQIEYVYIYIRTYNSLLHHFLFLCVLKVCSGFHGCLCAGGRDLGLHMSGGEGDHQSRGDGSWSHPGHGHCVDGRQGEGAVGVLVCGVVVGCMW